ncbi:MAG: hypothetical protein NT121_08380, partial [Chloroflexi bacterium]|nr:hypothetical protein [Chloroflexota bacterium]
MRRLLALSVLTVLLVSCAPSAPEATPRSLPTVTETAAATVTLAPATQTVIAPTGTVTATSTPTLMVIHTCGESESACILDGHFLFQRPIGLGGKQSIEQSYPYGNTQGGTREPHHGVEFYNA